MAPLAQDTFQSVIRRAVRVPESFRGGCSFGAASRKARDLSRATFPGNRFPDRRFVPCAIPAPGSIEIGAQPAFGGGQIDAPPGGIILQLIAPDPRNAEIFRLRMAEVKPADRCCGEHGIAFGQFQPGVVFSVEEFEQDRLKAMIRAGGIARRRTNAAILLLDQRVVGQLFFRRIAPQIGADMLVKPFGKRFGQTVGQCL